MSMTVETVPLASVTLDPANARKHPQANVEAIKGSLLRFGQQSPIVLDKDGVCRKGNGTVIAARALGWVDIKAVRTALTDTELTAYGIADNQTGLSSAWDDLALAKLLDSIKRDDEKLFAATGFDDAGFDALVAQLGDDHTAEKSIADIADEQYDGRTDMHSGKTVRVVMVVSDLSFVESVLASTGKDVKGEALVLILREYARTHAVSEKRQ